MGLLNPRSERHSGLGLLLGGLVAIVLGIFAFVGGACDLMW